MPSNYRALNEASRLAHIELTGEDPHRMTCINVKRCRSTAILPRQADGDVGFDVFAAYAVTIEPFGRAAIPIGWMLADEPIVQGSCIHGNLRTLIKVEGRSGLALIDGVWPVAGILDPTYRGEISVVLYNSTNAPYVVDAGKKIAQLVWYPVVANWHEHGRRVGFVEVDDIVDSERGAKGFGSSGNA